MILAGNEYSFDTDGKKKRREKNRTFIQGWSNVTRGETMFAFVQCVTAPLYLVATFQVFQLKTFPLLQKLTLCE